MPRALTAVSALLVFLTPAFANAADPPGRVGRVSYVDGTVSFHPPGQSDNQPDQDQGNDQQQSEWSPATVNYPVTTGESFWSDANSRATIEVGGAEMRLDQQTEVDMARIDDRDTDVQVDEGVLNLYLPQLPQGEVRVSTPRGQVVITAPGRYDIDAGQPNGDQPSDQVTVAVFDGAARFDGNNGTVDIRQGQSAVIAGDPGNVQLVAATPNDFDQWAQTQEEREAAAASRAPRRAAIPAAVTGYQDLDAYGSWNQDPNYGQVWYPSDMPAGWAPYRYGHWSWVAPWGWTWIDDAAWGFAPFHYGRWVDVGDRWAWVPGDIPQQPVYAPALVSFVGGNGWGVDLAAGAAVAAIGWVALAPHEVYHPWYDTNVGYARQVNGRDWNARTYNVTNVTINNFHNREAATVVPTAAFTHAARVQQATVAVPANQLATTRVNRQAVASLQPTAFSRSGHADPAAAAAIVPRANVQAHVAQGRVTETVPPALAQQKPPTAPAPRRVAAENQRNNTNAAAGANANAQNNAAAGAAATAPNQRTPRNAAQNNTAPNNSAAPNQAGREATRNAPNNPAAPNQAGREATRNAPNAGPNATERSALAPHPAPPNTAARNARGEPTAQAPAATAQTRTPAEQAQSRDATRNGRGETQTATPNQAQRNEPQRNAAAPNAPTRPEAARQATPSTPNATSRSATVQAPQPPRGAEPNAASRPENAPPREAARPSVAPSQATRATPERGAPNAPQQQRNLAAEPHTPAAQPPQRTAAAPAPAPERVTSAPHEAPAPRPQTATAPAPAPQRVAPTPHAAPTPAPHPAAAPAARPVAPAPAAHPAPAPHPAPTPRPAAAPAAAPHPAPAPAQHPAPAAAQHPAAAPAAHPAPAKAPAAAEPEKDKKQPAQ